MAPQVRPGRLPGVHPAKRRMAPRSGKAARGTLPSAIRPRPDRHDIPLGAHHHLPLLRRPDPPLPELAPCSGRDRGVHQASGWPRSEHRGPGLRLRDRHPRGAAVQRNRERRRRRMPLSGLRAHGGRKRDQAPGPSRPNGRAALRRGLQAARGDDHQDRPEAGEVGARLQGAASRGRCVGAGGRATRREVAGVGGVGLGPDGGDQRSVKLRARTPTLRHVPMARPLFAAQPVVPWHKRRGIPRDLGGREGARRIIRAESRCFRVSRRCARYGDQLRVSLLPLGHLDESGSIRFRQTQLFLRLVLRRDGPHDRGSRLRLGH